MELTEKMTRNKRDDIKVTRESGNAVTNTEHQEHTGAQGQAAGLSAVYPHRKEWLGNQEGLVSPVCC